MNGQKKNIKHKHKTNDPDLLPKDKEDLKFLKLFRDNQVVSVDTVARKLFKRFTKEKAKSFKPQDIETSTFSYDTLFSSTTSNSDTTPEELYIPPTLSPVCPSYAVRVCVRTQILEIAHTHKFATLRHIVVDHKITIIRQTINVSGTKNAPIQAEDLFFFVFN